MGEHAKLLVVSHTGNYPLDVGGPQAVAHYVSLHLAKTGFGVTLYQRFRSLAEAEKWDGTPEAKGLRDAGVETVRLIADYSLKNLWKYPHYVYLSPRRLGETRHDLVHYNSPPVDANILLPRIYFGRGSVQTVAIHGGLFYESRNVFGRMVFRRAVKYVHGAVALNDFSMRIALEQGFPQHRVHVIPNGVDVELVDSVEPKELEGEPAIVYAGRLEAVKGIHTLLEAARMLRNRLRGLRVYVVGAGSMEKQVRREARRAETNVRFVGRLPTVRDVIAVLKGADFVVVPSIKENFSIVLLEAMASGTPIIASNAEGNMAAVNQNNAWIFEKGSAQSLAQTIVEAHSQPEASERKAALARQAAEKHSWPEIAKKYFVLFKSLLEG